MEVDPYSHKQGSGWVLFAWIVLGFAGLINVIYGISALANSAFFVESAKYAFGDLRAWVRRPPQGGMIPEG